MRSGRGGGKNVGCRVAWTLNILLMSWICVKHIDQPVHICFIFHVHVSQGSAADRVALLRTASVRSPTGVGNFIFAIAPKLTSGLIHVHIQLYVGAGLGGGGGGGGG